MLCSTLLQCTRYCILITKLQLACSIGCCNQKKSFFFAGLGGLYTVSIGIHVKLLLYRLLQCKMKRNWLQQAVALIFCIIFQFKLKSVHFNLIRKYLIDIGSFLIGLGLCLLFQ